MKFKIVYADELDNVIEAKNAMLVDIRTREEYEKSHWKAAVSLPMDITDSYEELLNRTQPVIFYCTHGGSSMKLARYLGNRGFDTATVIGGYNALCGYQKKLASSIYASIDSFMSTGVAFRPARKPTPSAIMEKMAINLLFVCLKVRLIFLR